MSHIKTTNLSHIKTVIFDCDGVLWLENSLIKGALDLYKHLMTSNIRVFFVTNNSTKTTDEYLQKFANKNFDPPVEKSQIFGAAKMSAHYLKSKNVEKCYVLGAKAIDFELGLVGISSTRHEEDLKLINNDMEKFKNDLKLDQKVQAVVMGMDYGINYMKLALAATYIINQKCLFVATNPDASLPNESDKVLPGGGLILGGLEKVVQKPADAIAGKPSNFTTKHLIPDFDPKTTMMVGDRIETDVMFGVNSLCKTCVLVLSGASGIEKVEELKSLNNESGDSDCFYSESVAEILSSFKSGQSC